MTNAEVNRETEEELKKFNNYLEKLKKHFETEHTSGPGCRCKPGADGPPPHNPHNTSGGQNTKSGPSEAKKNRQEEEAARKRTAERERPTAEASAARRAAEAAQRHKINIGKQKTRSTESLIVKRRCSAGSAR